MRNSKFKLLLSLLACMIVVMIGGIMLTGCNNPSTDPERNLAKIYEAGVDQGGYRESEENVEAVWVIFRVDPSSISATFDGNTINAEKTTIENYDGSDSNVTAYQYLYELDSPVQIEAYDANPITITCTINGTLYEFTLTTDFSDRIFDAVISVEA